MRVSASTFCHFEVVSEEEARQAVMRVGHHKLYGSHTMIIKPAASLATAFMELRLALQDAGVMDDMVEHRWHEIQAGKSIATAVLWTHRRPRSQ